MRTPHTATYKGKRVKVVLKDGTEFIDRFKDSKSKYVMFDRRTVKRSDIKKFILIKGNHEKTYN